MYKHVLEVAITLVGEQGRLIKDRFQVFAFGKGVPVGSDDAADRGSVGVEGDGHYWPVDFLTWFLLEGYSARSSCSSGVGCIKNRTGIIPCLEKRCELFALAVEVG